MFRLLARVRKSEKQKSNTSEINLTFALKCYANTDDPAACKAQSEDYLECLHHTQEVCLYQQPSLNSTDRNILKIARAKAIKAQFIKKAEHEAKEGRKAGDILADGVIVSLGLINQGDGKK